MSGRDVLGLVVAALAAWRVTLLVTTDTIVGGLRRRLLQRYPSRTVPLYDQVTGQPVPETGRLKMQWPVELVNCDWCLGFWLAGAAVLVARWVGLVVVPWPVTALAWWAVAALVGALSDIVGR